MDCKRQILSTVPTSNCCGYAFLQTVLFSLANTNETHSAVFVFTKPDIINKFVKILNNFHPNIEINQWDDGLLLHGNLFELNMDHEFNLNQIPAECDRITALKTLFLLFGNLYYNQNPLKNSTGYNLEIIIKDEQVETMLKTLLTQFDFPLKKTTRNNSVVFYTKNSGLICDFLVKLGATGTALDIQNSLTMREVKNSTNRINNCFDSNLDKTINACTLQLNAIKYIMDNFSLDYLDENLREVALCRLANPDATLSELQKLLGGTISRAGIKYRLDKIIELRNKLKGEN